ncbi:hypothetical protein BVRB_2g029500 [Beta vulgaris subsp. vulgaris]|nr:hypothetical protein BVRB_2g029500 [Beta vulgaris subsp. vulgaris]
MIRRSLINVSRKLHASLLMKHSVNNLHHHVHLHLDRAAFRVSSHPFLQHRSQNPFALIQRLYSSSSPPNQSDPNPNPNPSNPEMKHQEIEGPTVEKDLSPLADETRKVTHSLLKTMYHVSSVLAFLGLAHLGLGAYSYASAGSSSNLNLMISAISFGFPFSMAFMLRQSLKSMHFFQKMEQIGRLQILTCALQISKQLRLFFLRVRALSFLCLAGLSFSFLYSLSSSLSL